MLKLSELKPGDRLVAGEGLICLPEGQLVEVIEAEAGGLAITCTRGEHLLGPRATKDGTLLGFTRAEAEVVPVRPVRGKGGRR